MKNFSPIVIFITTSTQKEAKKISDKLLKYKKVACVNIVGRIDSRFWWKGKIESANEIMLIAKTESKFFNDVAELVKKIHSYEVPEIIALPIIDGNKDYLEWIEKSLKNF